MSLNCSARSCVGWQTSKPSPPVACSLLICSSFCENGVELTLMPVAFSKSGITGSGNSSSQLMMLSSPEDDSALVTIAGEATAASAERRGRLSATSGARIADHEQTVSRAIHGHALRTRLANALAGANRRQNASPSRPRGSRTSEVGIG